VSGRGASDAAVRLFVAVDPPAEAVAHLGPFVDGLEVSRANAPGRSTRVAARDRWHITLAFLGDVPTERVDAAADAVRAAGAAWSGGPIEISVAGGGMFGRGPGTVLWAGLAGDVPALRALATDLRRTLRRARLPHDDRPPRPHLTLARPGARLEREVIRADVATLSGYAGPAWRVTEMRLVRSQLGPDPVHTTVATAALPP
jgi:2'-5' RNA ligase